MDPVPEAEYIVAGVQVLGHLEVVPDAEAQGGISRGQEGFSIPKGSFYGRLEPGTVLQHNTTNDLVF